MKVINIHKRTLNVPKDNISELLKTLSSKNDRVWPTKKWPAIRFDTALKLGATGGHGPIKYTIEKYDPSSLLEFRFLRPTGFDGIHKFEILKLTAGQTKVSHTIDMKTIGKATLLWIFVIGPLHNALIEDTFDKIENHFTDQKKTTRWSLWVKLLRKTRLK